MGKTKRPYLWLPLWIAVGIAVGILIGNLFSKYSSGFTFYGGNRKIDQVLDYISRSYVDTVNVNDLTENAIPIILEGLDPHSNYISAADMELTGDELEGHFSGIGVEFIIQNDTVAIVNVIPGGPSEAVGIFPDDRIVMVNDSVFAGIGLTNSRVFRQLRGKKNSQVKLGIKRTGIDSLMSYVVTRADVPVKSVDVAYQIDNGIGYIKISKFAATTYNEFINAIAKLKSQGCNSFILDLQGNTGGYLNAAVLMTNEFLERRQLIVYTEGRAYPRENVFADGSGTCKENQLVVLLDEISASASEVFSGAIQDNDRGLIMGRRSFGKGLVQSQHDFPDGSAIRLTIARYHSASGRCIQKAYEKGNRGAYDQDYLNRFYRGEFDNEDSIKMDNLPLFHTVAGRPVYGDDGIMPDIFVPRDTIGQNSYYIKVANLGLIREYSFAYTESNRERLKSFSSWKDAAAFLEKQPLVENLVSLADSKGIRRRPVLINESYRVLQSQISALILLNVFGEEAFYSVYLKDDNLLRQAINAIRTGLAAPSAIRSEKYKSLRKSDCNGLYSYNDRNSGILEITRQINSISLTRIQI